MLSVFLVPQYRFWNYNEKLLQEWKNVSKCKVYSAVSTQKSVHKQTKIQYFAQNLISKSIGLNFETPFTRRLRVFSLCRVYLPENGISSIELKTRRLYDASYTVFLLSLLLFFFSNTFYAYVSILVRREISTKSKQNRVYLYAYRISRGIRTARLKDQK